MKAIIHYFSGTGNSKRASDILKKVLLEHYYDVKLLSVEKPEDVNPGNYELSIFIFPVYACSVPNIMKKYMNSLPNVNKNKAVIIAIHGEADIKHTIPGYEGQSINEAMRILIKKGYNVFLTDKIGYPVNFTMVANTPNENQIRGIFEQADMKILEIANRIIKGDVSIKKCNVFNMIWSKLFGLIYTLAGRRLLGKMYLADMSCSSCGVCVRCCPAKVIKMNNGLPRWNFNCEGCQRCINLCPNKSIQTSLVRLVVYIVITFLPYSLIFDRYIINLDIIQNQFISIIFDFLIWVLGFVGLVYLADKIIFGLERFPGINRLFQTNITKYFRRYLEPNFKPFER